MHAIREDADLTAQMHRLIWVFAGCTGLLVGFGMCWLIYKLGMFVLSTCTPQSLYNTIVGSIA